jgi:tetratricopeptide (TPR) repeat protein
MTPRRSAVTAALAALGLALALAGVAAAAPRRPTAAPARLDRKHLDAERHIWNAQFYLMRANDLAGAARDFKAAVALAPDNVDASNLARTLELLGKPGDARRAYQQYVALYPGTAWTRAAQAAAARL